ncbi:MAG: inositol monophosphatase family protein [Chitinophagales bacterium]|nr:inositol monophosphatase [Bacteroidota bacterium]
MLEESLFLAVKELLARAAIEIRKHQANLLPEAIRTKSKNSLVSAADMWTEQFLLENFQKLLPESQFLAEETKASGEHIDWAGFVWIIDPIDGTTNFIHQVFPCAISVALYRDGEAWMAWVYEITSDQCFSAVKNKGAFVDRSVLRVASNPNLENALLATGFPYYDFEKMESYWSVLQQFMQHTRGIRRFGAASMDLVWVAQGKFDAFFEHSLSPWDVAAGTLIVQEAGGVVTDFSGGNNFLFGREIIAASANIYPSILAIFKKHWQ